MSENEQAQIRKNRQQIIMLATIFLLPFIIYAGVKLVGYKPGLKNNGVLVKPVTPLPNFELTTLKGEKFKTEDLFRYWHIVHIAGPECDESCATKLLITREARQSVKKDWAQRVRRVLLLRGGKPSASMQKVLEVNPQLIVLTGNEHEMNKLLEFFTQFDSQITQGVPGHIYISDTEACVMMTYKNDSTMLDIVGDLNVVLEAPQQHCREKKEGE
jgi:cytochrome oxidase Cu insertion factor (SCO1/SenC/PrrC family)